MEHVYWVDLCKQLPIRISISHGDVFLPNLSDKPQDTHNQYVNAFYLTQVILCMVRNDTYLGMVSLLKSEVSNRTTQKRN